MRMAAWRLVVAGAVLVAACARQGGGDAPRDAGAGAPVPATALVPNAPDGYHLTMTGSADAGTGVPQWAASMMRASTTVQVLRGRARVDNGPVAQPGIPNGAYWLLDADSGTATLVSTDNRSAIVQRAASPAQSASGPPLEAADTTWHMEDLGAGDTILGIPTRKYRVHFAYRLQSPGAVNPPMWRTEVQLVLHVSGQVAALDPVLARLPELMSGGITAGVGATSLPAVDTLVRRRPPGFALRQEREAMSIVGRDTTRSRTNWQVTGLRRGGVRAEDLQVPAGYTVRRAEEAVTAPVR